MIEKYPSGSRGAPAKGVDRVTGARVRIPSSLPYFFWPVGQAVKTPPFHGGNTGSSPVRVISKAQLFVITQVTEFFICLLLGL